MLIIISQMFKCFCEENKYKRLNRTQFFFTYRTVMFIKGEILINSPAKLQKTYENEIT